MAAKKASVKTGAQKFKPHANPWFRMYAEFIHDPKVQMLSETMQRRYIMLMCLRCSNTLCTLSESELSFYLRINAEELELTKAVFIRSGFINPSWELLNWGKRQFASDNSSDRVAKTRAKQKAAKEVALNLIELDDIQTL